jgi:HPt (histidine-containing phosphotransfer) domain-containing protein
MSADFDPTALRRLHEAGGADLVQQMVRLFLEHTPSRITILRSGLDGGDRAEMERAAHSMKSSAAHLGLESLRSQAARIEELAEQGRAVDLRPLVERVADAFPGIREALVRAVEKLS